MRRLLTMVVLITCATPSFAKVKSVETLINSYKGSDDAHYFKVGKFFLKLMAAKAGGSDDGACPDYIKTLTFGSATTSTYKTFKSELATTFAQNSIDTLKSSANDGMRCVFFAPQGEKLDYLIIETETSDPKFITFLYMKCEASRSEILNGMKGDEWLIDPTKQK